MPPRSIRSFVTSWTVRNQVARRGGACVGPTAGGSPSAPPQPACSTSRRSPASPSSCATTRVSATMADSPVDPPLHDALTGLATRALFRDRVEHALERARRLQLPLAAVLLEFDDFRAGSVRATYEELELLLSRRGDAREELPALVRFRRADGGNALRHPARGHERGAPFRTRDRATGALVHHAARRRTSGSSSRAATSASRARSPKTAPTKCSAMPMSLCVRRDVAGGGPSTAVVLVATVLLVVFKPF